MYTWRYVTGVVYTTGAAGTSTIFWLYALACAVSVVFVAACVPETKDRSLEQVNDALTVQRRRLLRLYDTIHWLPLFSPRRLLFLSALICQFAWLRTIYSGDFHKIWCKNGTWQPRPWKKWLDQGCPTYGPRARIRPAKRFNPAREAREAYWHSTTWEVLWISFALIDDFQQRFKNFIKHWHHEAAEWSVSSWSHC